MSDPSTQKWEILREKMRWGDFFSFLRFSVFFFSRDLGAIKGGHCGDVRSFLRDVSNEWI